MAFDLLTALAAGYLLGGIPSAELAARLRNRSIFDVGSGNMGAMNTARNLGPILGVLVFAADVAKGAGATALGLWMGAVAGGAGSGELAPALAAGLGAVLGHAWSPYVRFRGGKALATIFGASLPLYPLGGVYGLLLLVGLVLLLRRTTVASVLALGLYPVVVLFTLIQQGAPRGGALAIAVGVAALAAISVTKHLQTRGASRDGG